MINNLTSFKKRNIYFYLFLFIYLFIYFACIAYGNKKADVSSLDESDAVIELSSINVTVYESLLYSAWLRLASDVDEHKRKVSYDLIKKAFFFAVIKNVDWYCFTDVC